VEGQFLADVAQRRWPVLIFIFCFDVFCYMLRLGARLAANVRFGLVELAAEMGPQLANMSFCYLFLGLVNTRSRRGGGMASRQVSACSLQECGQLACMPCVLSGRRACCTRAKRRKAMLCAGSV